MHTLASARERLARAVAARRTTAGTRPGETAPHSLRPPRLAATSPAQALPDHVAQRLEEAKLLVGVPLAYLAPDPRLLPAESLQFFTVDPAWVLALRQGMLSIGSPDPAFAQTHAAPGEPLPGLLLSSSLVRQYPGLSVRAWTGSIADSANPDAPASGATPVTLVRAERLTANILVCLFTHTPDLVVIEEPHGMVRLGVRRNQAGAAVLAVRQNDGQVAMAAGAPVTVPVPMRGNADDGVVDVTALAAALDTAIGGLPNNARPPSPSASSSAMALQLLLPPVRQRYRRGGQP